MKRILVSGGAGLIGSHLRIRLVNEGHGAICLDNFFIGSKDNIKHLMGNHRFEVVRHDVAYPYSAGADEVYNLACPASPIHYQHDPIQTVKTSVMGAINVLRLTMRLDAKILRASTSEVYDDPIIYPQPKNYWRNTDPVGYRSCYDEGGRHAETLFMDYYRQNQTCIRIIHIFNTYGLRMFPNDGHVVSNFIIQALNNEDIAIYGDGKQTHSFQYIDDLIERMVRMMDTEDGFTGPINIGNSDELPALELAERVIRVTGSVSKIVFKLLPTNGPKQCQPDIKLAREKLGWQPTVELEGGLRHMVEYLENV